MLRIVSVLSLALIFAVSCGAPPTQPEQDAPSAEPVSPPPASTQADTTTAQAAPQPSARSAEQKAGDAKAAQRDMRAISPDELKELVRAAQEHAALVDERTSVLVEGFVDQGLAALERGDVSEAHTLFAHAYQLDPDNPVARDLFDRTGAVTGDERATIGALADSARGMSEVRRQQRGILVDNKLEQGQRAMQAGDFDQAIVHFEDALALVRFNPDATGSGDEADIAALLASARYERDRALEQRDAEIAQRAAEVQQQYDRAEENRTQLQIDALLRTADDAFLRDDYDTAIGDLDKVLQIDPRHEVASHRRRIAFKAKNEMEAQKIRRDYRDQWQKTFDDLENDTLIPNDPITYPSPDEWAKIDARGAKTFQGRNEAKDPDDLAVADKLANVRIPVNFTDATLADVVSNLQQVAQVNFLLSPDARDAGGDEQYNLLDRNPQPVQRVLKTLLEDLSITPMTYTIRDGVVRIITKDEARDDYVLEMYDIRDLTFTPVDHAAEDFNLLPSGTDKESFTEGVEDDEPLPLVSSDTLQSLILDNIAPETWTDDPNRTISEMSGTLIVKTTPDVHEQIRSLLADLRQNTTTLISIQTRFIEVEDSFLEDIGVDLRGLDPATGGALEDFGQANVGGVGTPNAPAGIGTDIDTGAYYAGKDGDLKGRTEHLFDTVLGETGVLSNSGGLSLEALFLNNTNVNAVLRAVRKYQNSNIVNAPSLTLRSGQRGNIRVLTNRTYVRDFEPEIAQAAVIAQPELDVVKDGIVLDVRAAASADRRFITLELRPTVAELIPDENGNPLKEELVSLGTPNANNVTLQLPELKIQRLRTTATVPDGATLLLGGLKTSIEQDQTSETPFLSDIPFIGALFRHKGEYTSKRKLLILLTATIIDPEEQEPGAPFRR
ncbi:MAG: hypothetical protein H6825_04280 [Planctomycetes bacterium]|nr:hypothetical protein [Planctomycetota bacterium]